MASILLVPLLYYCEYRSFLAVCGMAARFSTAFQAL